MIRQECGRCGFTEPFWNGRYRLFFLTLAYTDTNRKGGGSSKLLLCDIMMTDAQR